MTLVQGEVAELGVEQARSSSLVKHEWAETGVVVWVEWGWGGGCWEIKSGGGCGELKSVM